MKPTTALFVNTSRPNSSKPTLLAALNRGPGMAAVDVFESDPFSRVIRCCGWKTASAHPYRLCGTETATNFFCAAFDNVVNEARPPTS